MVPENSVLPKYLMIVPKNYHPDHKRKVFDFQRPLGGCDYIAHHSYEKKQPDRCGESDAALRLFQKRNESGFVRVGQARLTA